MFTCPLRKNQALFGEGYLPATVPVLQSLKLDLAPQTPSTLSFLPACHGQMYSPLSTADLARFYA